MLTSTSFNVSNGSRKAAFSRLISTTNFCRVCHQILPISARTLSFRLQTSQKFCSHLYSNIPICYLWTAFCVPLSFIFYEKQSFRMEIVRLRHSRCYENGNNDFGVEAFWAIHCAPLSSGFMVLNASISRVLGQRPTFYCPLFVICFVFHEKQAIPRNRCVVLALLSR